MNVSLTPELERYIQDKVTAGLYTSASEVIRESLRLMHQYDDIHQKRLQELQQAIDQGMVQWQQQQVVDGKTSLAKMKQKLNNLNT